MASENEVIDIPVEDMLTPDYDPVDFRCIVQIRNVKDGVIALTDDYKRQKLQETCEGMLVSRGINAFQDILDEKDRPQIGEMVKFVKYAGNIDKIPANEEYAYKIIPDGDVIGRKHKKGDK